MAETDIIDIGNLVERIKPLLAGRPSKIQGAALADLLAIWLAGHVIAGDAEATHELRAKLLEMHVDKVLDLIPVNARMMGTPP
jgi:hypothetical protein